MFYDSRNDCYPRAISVDGWAVDQQGDLGPLTAYDVPWAIALEGSRLDDALAGSAEWELVTSAEVARLYAHH